MSNKSPTKCKRISTRKKTVSSTNVKETRQKHANDRNRATFLNPTQK